MYDILFDFYERYLYLVPFSKYSTPKFLGFDPYLWPLKVLWVKKFYTIRKPIYDSLFDFYKPSLYLVPFFRYLTSKFLWFDFELWPQKVIWGQNIYTNRKPIRCASSSMELQLKTAAQTLTLASSSAEDNIQDRSHHCQRANFRTAIQSPQFAGQLHSFTKSEVRRTTSSSNSIPKISCRQTQLLLRCADHLEQPQLINTGSNLNWNIQDTSQNRTVSLGLSVNIHRPPPLHQNPPRTIIYCSLPKLCK